MVPAIVVESILLAILIAYIFVSHFYLIPREIERAKKKGGEEFFELIMAGGYDKLVGDFKEYNTLVKESGIVFVGDSLTQNYNVYEFFKGYDVYNRGIGGDTTEGLLKRMDESIFDLKPKIVVLLIGINDFSMLENATSKSVYENVLKIVNQIKERLPETKIILESLYPIYEGENPKIDKPSIGNKTNSQIDETNALIKKIPGVTYVDVNSHLTDDNGNFKLEYTMEGLHANSTGYQVITKILKKKIDSLLKE